MPFFLTIRKTSIKIITTAVAIVLAVCYLPANSFTAPLTSQDKKEENAGKLRVESSGRKLGGDLLREPLGLDVDESGNLFVADAMTGKVFRFSPDGRGLEFEKPASGEIYPIDLSVFGAFVYVLDYSSNRLLRYDQEGTYLDILISFSVYDRLQPVSVTGTGGGGLITTDLKNHGLTIWTPLMDLEYAWNEYGWAEGALDRPIKAIMLPDERIAVSELGNRRVQLFSPSGQYESLLSLPGGDEFKSPRSLCCDRQGNIFVADTEAGRVYIFSAGGELEGDIDIFEGEGISPSAVAVGWNDDLYVADIRSRSILLFSLRYSDN